MTKKIVDPLRLSKPLPLTSGTTHFVIANSKSTNEFTNNRTIPTNNTTFRLTKKSK